MIKITYLLYTVPIITFATMMFLGLFFLETKFDIKGKRNLLWSYTLYFFSTLLYAIFANLELEKLQIISFILLMLSNYLFYLAICKLVRRRKPNRQGLKFILSVLLPSILYSVIVITNSSLFLRGTINTVFTGLIFFRILLEMLEARKNKVVGAKASPLLGAIFLYFIILLIGLNSLLVQNVEYSHIGSTFEIITYLFSSLIRVAIAFGYTLLVQRVIFKRSTVNDYVKLDDYNYLLRVSEIDHLTGIYNRQKIDRILTEYVSEERKNFFILFIDVDNFKKINDTLGHVVGDKVLVEIADCLKKVIRSNDFVGRWAGDEYMIIVNECDDHIASVMVQRVKQAVEALTLDDINKLSVSVGVAKPKGLNSVTELIHVADIDLYEDKNNKDLRFLLNKTK